MARIKLTTIVILLGATLRSTRGEDDAQAFTPSPEMQELVTRGHGIAFQTNVGLDRRLADRSLVFIPIDAKGPLWSDLGIYTRAGRLLPTATDNFVQELKAEIHRRQQAEKDSHG